MTYILPMSEFEICFKINQFHTRWRFIFYLLNSVDIKLVDLSVKFVHTTFVSLLYSRYVFPILELTFTGIN